MPKPRRGGEGIAQGVSPGWWSGQCNECGSLLLLLLLDLGLQQLAELYHGRLAVAFELLRQRQRAAGRVAHAYLELPQLRPVVRLVVLTHLQHQHVLALLERAAAGVDVERRSVV